VEQYGFLIHYIDLEEWTTLPIACLSTKHGQQVTIHTISCGSPGTQTGRIVRVPSGCLRGIKAGPVILSQGNAVLNAERQIRVRQEVSAKHDRDVTIGLVLVNSVLCILQSISPSNQDRRRLAPIFKANSIPSVLSIFTLFITCGSVT